MCAMHLLLCYDLTGVRITKLPPSDKNDTKLGKSSVTGIVQACYSNAIMIHVIIRQNAVFICLYAKNLWWCCHTLSEASPSCCALKM